MTIRRKLAKIENNETEKRRETSKAENEGVAKIHDGEEMKRKS